MHKGKVKHQIGAGTISCFVEADVNFHCSYLIVDYNLTDFVIHV
jgi:hypothetical protein